MAGSLDSLRGLSGGKKPFLDPFAKLSGLELENAGWQAMQDIRDQDRAEREAIRQNSGMSFDQQYKSRSADRREAEGAISSPAWEAFFGILRGKEAAARASGRSFKTEGLDRPTMFQEGRVVPGTDNVIEGIGNSYWIDDFNHGFDPNSETGYAPGSLAARSGLSTQALRLLSGRGR